ncbi:MAG: ribosome maturation factor RimP [Clostridia bacterium]|nr:ribosome maturation factor RimP [Clostridia bacterium]
MAEKKGRGKIAALVWDLIREPVQQAGYLLWDVDYYKEGADYNLLVTIENPDRQKPIDLEDCEKVSRLLSPLLDEKDPIAEAYYLEVSSAGLWRELKLEEHFAFYMGERVRVKLYAPKGGKKEFEGNLLSYGEEGLALQTQEADLLFKKEEIAKVTTAEEIF